MTSQQASVSPIPKEKPLELMDCVKALETLFKDNRCRSHIKATYINEDREEFELVFKKIECEQ